MKSNINTPLNLGSDHMVTINQLIAMISEISGKTIQPKYDLSKPVGPKGRNSDNTLIHELLDWKPDLSLEFGMAQTYKWIDSQLSK